MPDIQFNLTGDTVGEFIDDWAYAIGYQNTVTENGIEITNPVSKQDFLISQFISSGKNAVMNYRTEKMKVDIVTEIQDDLDGITVEM